MTTSVPKFKVQSEMPVFEDEISKNTGQTESISISGLSLPQTTDHIPIRRLVVLVPNVDIDEVKVAREIWETSTPAQLSVLYLGLCTDIVEEPHMRRMLAMLAALTRDARINVETRLEFGRNWIRSLKPISRAGDVVVCFAEQQTALWHKPLSEALEKTGASVWTLSEFYPMKNNSSPGPYAGILFWGLSIVILTGFFWLQVQTIRLTVEWAKDTLLYLSVPGEVGALWFLHKILS